MKTRKFQTLTKAEMQVMTILWNMDNAASVSAVIGQYPDPQPAYTTIATFLNILEKKGFVGRKKSGAGKSFLYYPLVGQQAYTARAMAEVKDTLFGGSAKSLVNFFVREDMLSREDIEELLEMIKE